MAGKTMFVDEIAAIVISVGSFSTKAGEAGEDTPKAVFPTNIGCVVTIEGMENYVGQGSLGIGEMSHLAPTQRTAKKTFYVDSNDLSVFRPNMEVFCPVVEGAVRDWDALEKLWDHAFYNCLCLDYSERPVLFSEPSFNSKEQREKLTEIVFEKYKPRALFIAKEATLSAYASGRATALVVDSGADMTLVTPVHDGYVLQRSIFRSVLAGNKLTDALYSLIQPRIQSIGDIRPKYLFSKRQNKGRCEITPIPRTHATASYHNYQVRLILNDMKESLCRVSEEPFEDTTSVSQQSYELPDGSIIQLDKERYRLPELMFQSNIQVEKSKTATPVQDMVIECVSKADADIRKELCSSVIVTGGNTLFKGFPERLQKEIQNKANYKVKMIAPTNSSERRFSSWIGGSILGSLGSFHQMWMSKEEYDEVGKSLVNAKCP